MNEIDIKFMDCSQLIEIINEDIRSVSVMSEEISKIKKQKVAKIDRKAKHTIVNIDSNSSFNTNITDEVENEFEDEAMYYFEIIDKLPNSNNLKDRIKLELPNRNNINFHKLLLRLKIELVKNIKEIKDMISEDNSFDIDDLKELKEDINFNQKKIDLISEIEAEKQIDNTSEKTNNHLIFVTTNSGNIRVIEDIKKIDVEFHSRILELLLSIKDGSMKSPKNFINNNRLVGISEVRNYQVRVIYDRISADCYAIITAFVKKSDKDKSYRDSLTIKVKNYSTIKDSLKKNILNDEFLNEQRQIENEIYNMLGKAEVDTKGKERQYVK